MSPIISARGGLSSAGYGQFALIGGATSFDSIATYTVGSGGASSVTFTLIPSTYKHLQIRYSAIGSGDPLFVMNGNYSTKTHRLMGDGSTAQANADYPNQLDYYFGLTSTQPSVGVIDILDYASTSKNKTVRYLHGIDKNGSGEIILGSKLYATTSAITSVAIEATFSQYSIVALYGIKGA